jgi:hypothetical protein
MKARLRDFVVRLFVLASLLCVQHAQADLGNVYRKWTYTTDFGQLRTRATFISTDLIDEWLAHEKSPAALERIRTLKETIGKNGYYVYLLHFHNLQGGFDFSISPVRQRTYVQITERSPEKYAPVAYSGNLDGSMAFGQDYYGVVAFKLPIDEFAFQTLAVDVARSSNIPRKACRDCSDYAWCCPQTVPLRFSFHPNGAPEKHQASSIGTGDILGMLKIALQIVRFLKV